MLLYLLICLVFSNLVDGVEVVKSFLTKPTHRCNKESIDDVNFYIEYIGRYTIIRKCQYGSIYSSFFCACVQNPTSLPVTATTQTRTSVAATTDEDENFCRPYFHFVFDRTFLSLDRSTPSQPTNYIRFVSVPGATGRSAAHFNGNGTVTIWSASYITFAYKFKFSIRFKLLKDYEYENKFYSLFGDGPCNSNFPRYSFTVNPVSKEIHAFIYLRNKDSIEMILPDVDLRGWIEVTLKAIDGELTLFTEDIEAKANIGMSTIKSSPCPLQIGKDSEYAEGFVGYIDSIIFNNCF